MNTSSVLRYWCAPLFTLGAIRGYRAELPHDCLFSDRLFSSFMNGVFYLHPFFTFIKLKHTLDRIQVRIENKNPDNYPSIYREIQGTNKNTFL